MDETPASLFDAYEQDLLHLIRNVGEKLEGDVRLGGEQRKAALRKVELELDEADDIISQLELEIQGIPSSIKPGYLTRLKAAKANIQKYKKLSKEAHAQSARSDLLSPAGMARSTSSRSDDPYDERADERNRLLAGSQVLSDGTRRIAGSVGLALETEAHGAEILTTLRGQREQIQSSRDVLGGADNNIDRASRTIGGMIRQAKKQRVIVVSIIAFAVLLILVILYFKLIRR